MWGEAMMEYKKYAAGPIDFLIWMIRRCERMMNPCSGANCRVPQDRIFGPGYNEPGTCLEHYAVRSKSAILGLRLRLVHPSVLY